MQISQFYTLLLDYTSYKYCCLPISKYCVGTRLYCHVYNMTVIN